MSRLPTARIARTAGKALAATSLAVALAAGPAAAATYEVERGDTLSGLAVRFDTTVRQLAQLNGLSNAHRIVAGRTIQVPGGGSGGSSSGSVAGRHVVQRGETLSGIAARYGTTVRQLVEANGLRSPHQIVAGRGLTLPGTAARASGAAEAPAPANRSRHLVRAGETLTSIARRHGVSLSDLARWNGITRNNVVYAGTSLVLYDPGPLSSRSIVCPVPGARFSNGWGFPRPGGRVHAGNDLFARKGTPVYAPVSGTVTTAVGSIGGLQFRLVDAAGDHWLGTHLDAFGKSGWVRAGDIIGYVGDSGNARGTDPHLHFEYQPGGGEPVNAYPLLRAAC